MRGAYDEGWPLFEARWVLPYHGGAQYREAAQWRGEPVGHLLLYAEQGLGDTIQMLRFLPEALRRCGGAVTLLVQPALERIARRAAGGEQARVVTVVADDERFDAACGLMSLPGVLGISSPEEADRGLYLSHDAARTAQFASRLAANPGRKLGIVWQGGQAGSANRRRRLPEAALLPLLDIPGWTAVSLQFGVSAPTIAGRPLVDLSHDIADFDDLAAAMGALDAVVSLDSGPAHLAGALGLPTWILVPWLHDWRWGLGSEGCAWYQSARLVRQSVGGSWDDPVAGLAARLAGDAEAKPTDAGPVRRTGPIVHNDFPDVRFRAGEEEIVLPLTDPRLARALLRAAPALAPASPALANWLEAGGGPQA